MRVKAARRRPALPCGGRTNDWTQAEDDVYRRAVAHVTTVAAGTAPNARAAETATAAAGGRATFARGALLYLAAVALVVSRRPDGITYPQFWAEDGMVWFAQAYNEGALPALLSPWTGYAQTFSRLVAAVSLLVPFRDAPLVFNVAAVLAQALAPFFLASSRLASVIPDRRIRLLAALLWIGAPNGFEIQSNVTNAQTHFALLSLLIVLADAPPTRAWAVFDVSALLLGGLSGPTCVLLVPVAALAWLREPRRWRFVVLATLAVPAAVQLGVYLRTGGAGRQSTALGASAVRFLQIVGGQVFFAGTLGAKLYERLFVHGGRLFAAVPLLAGIGGLAFVARALRVSRSAPLRLFVLFATLALAAALWSPVLSAVPRWDGLRLPNVGIRYVAPPILAWLAVLLWSACADPSGRARLGARLTLAAVLLIGLPSDWRVAPRPDLDFPRHAERFERRRPGKPIRIPIPPEGWKMKLWKR